MRMTRQDEKGAAGASRWGLQTPPLALEIAVILLCFLAVVSVVLLLRAPLTFSTQVILNVFALAAFPVAIGIWQQKRWALYASLLLLEPLLLIYPLIAAFSPYFGIEYNWIALLSALLVALISLPLILTDEQYAGILQGARWQWLVEKLPVFNALFVIFGTALAIRTVLPYDTVFKDTVRFASDDAVYHMRLVENALLGDHFPRRISFDAYTNYPYGTNPHFGPLYDLFIVFATWIISLGAPTKVLMDAVGAYYPAILGALVVFPVYIIGRELYNKYAGIIAAVLVATLPGQFLSRSIIGFTDHHVGEALLSTIVMMLLVLALKRAKEQWLDGDFLALSKKSPKEWLNNKNFPFICFVALILVLFQIVTPEWWLFISFILFLLAPLIFGIWKKPDPYLLYGFLAGMALGYYLLTWFAGLVFIFIIFAYGVIQYTINGLRKEQREYICVTLIPVFVIPLIMIIPFLGYPLYYDIRHISTLSMGLILFALPLLYHYLVTRLSKNKIRAGAEEHALTVEKTVAQSEYQCPLCGKKMKGGSIVAHIKAKHSGELETKSDRKIIKQFFSAHPELKNAAKKETEPVHGSTLLETMSRYEFLFPGLMVLIFLFLAVAFFPSVLSTFSYFSPSGTALTVAEVHPMDPETVWIWFGTPFFISLFTLALLLVNIVKKNRPEEVLVVTWSMVMFIMVGGLGLLGIENIGQNRFAYYYTVNVAILTGVFAGYAFDALAGIGKTGSDSATRTGAGKKGGRATGSAGTLDLPLIVFAFAIMAIAIIGLLQVGIWSLIPLAGIIAIFILWIYTGSRKRPKLESPLRKTLAVILIMVVVFYPFPLNAVAEPFPSNSNLPLSAAYALGTAERGIGADEEWYEALRWMRNSTPEPGVDYYGLYEVPEINATTGARDDYKYPPEAYGVMSWWDYGHMITWIGHRIPNANPFQQGIGDPIGSNGRVGASTFFILNNETAASEVADELGVRYVISDYMMADIWNSYYNKYGAMTVWAGDPERYSSLGYYYTTMEARLHMFDGTRTNIDGTIIPALHHYRLVHESPKFVLPMVIMDENTGNMYWRSYSNDYNTTAAQARILHGHLFDLPAGAWIEDDLNNETLPELLVTAFNSSGIPFSEQSVVNRVSEGRWAIQDATNNNVFILARSEGMLQVYLYGVRTGQENVKAWTPEYLQPVSFVKVFEYVPGARITGTAANGSVIEISTAITTNQGRTFTYALETTAAPTNTYEFIVPYSTDGPIAGGTNFDVSVTPYTLSAGHYENETLIWDTAQEVHVSEMDVMNGGTVTIDLL